MSTLKERLIKFIAHLDQGGQKKFEQKVGLSNGFINNIGDSLRKKSIDKIKKQYPELNISWLLTGEGEMIIGNKDKNVSLIQPIESLTEPKSRGIVPYYPNITLTGGAVEVYNGSKPIEIVYINLGDAFSDATGAMQVNGHSMYPNYENGCIVGYREVIDKSYFFYGETYVVGTPDYQMLKRIKQSPKEGFVILASDNKEKDEDGKLIYRPVEIEVDKIRFLAIVIGKISRSQMKLIK